MAAPEPAPPKMGWGPHCYILNQIPVTYWNIVPYGDGLNLALVVPNNLSQSLFRNLLISAMRVEEMLPRAAPFPAGCPPPASGHTQYGSPSPAGSCTRAHPLALTKR